MGFSLNGTCYKDAAQALANWKNSFPHAQADSVTQENSSSVTVGGLLTYNLTTDDLTANKSFTNSGTVQMRPCDYNDVTLGADYGFTVFIGCAIMFALGFIGTR